MYDMTVYLIRHGETDLNKGKCLQGQSDTMLNAYGRELAKITGEALAEVPFDAAYTSPLSRATETARLVLGDREIPVQKEERIKEIAFGIYEGCSYHPDYYTVPDPDFIHFFKAPHLYKVPEGGESFEEVIARTGDFWRELTNNPAYEGKTVLVSTHGCALKCILANIRQTSIEKFWGEGVHKNCAVTIVKIKGNEITVDEGKIFYEDTQLRKNSSYEYVLFDLDGTLTDPGEGITNSVAYALKKFGIEVKDTATLYKFIGPPLQESFEKYYGLSEADAKLAIQYYREYYKPKGIYENHLYDGIEEMLFSLKERGKKLLVATSKPEAFAVEILKYFHIYEYFDFVGGASMDEKRVKKAEIIEYVRNCCKIPDVSAAVMIGDREHDIFGAKENQMDSIGVLYGYGDRPELENAGASYLAEGVKDILELLS